MQRITLRFAVYFLPVFPALSCSIAAIITWRYGKYHAAAIFTAIMLLTLVLGLWAVVHLARKILNESAILDTEEEPLSNDQQKLFVLMDV